MKSQSDVKRFARYLSVVNLLLEKESFQKPEIYEHLAHFTREGASWGKLNKIFKGKLGISIIIQEINSTIAA